MAETNISADKTEGQKIQAEHVNELKNAMVTTFSGRDASGTMAANQQLGSATFPWGLAYINSLISNGKLIDFNSLTTEPNIIKSGKTRSTSDLPDFVRASGSSNSATIQGATTNLTCVVNGVTAVLTTDSVISSLTTASTGAANECLINDTSIADQLSTKYLGDQNTFITVDTMGANISAKVGEYVCLKSSTEYMLAYVESTTKLTNIKRGFFFDSNGDPIVRETLANNDVLSLMSLGWVFLEDDGATLDVSYNAPIYDFVQPSSPSTGDYWFDLQNKQWRRYDGANFVVIKRILIGLVVIDSANCVASRSLDFDLLYSDINSIGFATIPFSSEIIRSKNNDNLISVNANTLEQRISKVEYNITTDRDTGVSESANTEYYMYITQDGQNVISDEKPYGFNAKLQGYYHPYQSWRCVGFFFNDGSSNISTVNNVEDLNLDIPNKDIGPSIADYKFSAQTTNHDRWLKCDGTAISRTTYATLFGIVGTAFGIGDGSTTFNLPDQRGKVPGAIGQGAGLTNRTLGNNVGEENHQLSIAELAQHRHNMTSNATNGAAGTASPYSSAAGPTYTNTDDIQLTGSNVAHNTMQPTLFIGNLFIFAGV